MTTSLSGQDLWVLKKLNNKRNGYFLEMGAYDGIKTSNTYILEKDYDWTGICVEPNPKMYPFLVQNRSCICENVCVYHSKGTAKFVQRRKKGRSASGIYDEESTNWINSLAEMYPDIIIELPTTTLLDILQRHNAPKVIDYFSLDTEGSEYQILKDFDFDTYTFLTLTVEHGYFGGNLDPVQLKKRENIFALLTSKGYIRAEEKAFNEDWYTHKSLL